MRFIRTLMVALALFAVAGAVQARTSRLADPAPVAVPAGLGEEKLVKDIKRALAGRGWEVTAEQAGRIDATLHLREHVASIRVSYDDKAVQFAYVSSSNLDYEVRRGARYIHRNYLGWISYLTGDLATNMQLSAAE